MGDDDEDRVGGWGGEEGVVVGGWMKPSRCVGRGGGRNQGGVFPLKTQREKSCEVDAPRSACASMCMIWSAIKYFNMYVMHACVFENPSFSLRLPVLSTCSRPKRFTGDI